ncbi:MAG: response regulator [SAR324 cluster bacterium]|nr:response regulator [SAR324 cluster bacterium]
MGTLQLSDIIYQHLYQEACLIFLCVDQKGEILDVNQYARDMVGPDLMTKITNLYDVLIDFGNLPSLEELLKDGRKPRMLNFNTVGGLPQTFYFHFYEHDSDILVLGQQDNEETEILRKHLLDSNSEANNLSRELQKSNVQLAKLNELKNHFLGMAAHDLRNPISIIQQYSEFLLSETESKLAPEQLDLLSKIRNSSHFMLTLLNDLLDISKIESGKLDLELHKTEIVSFIEKCLVGNRVLASKKKIRITYHHYEKLPLVRIDRTKIEQVLNNLLSNAIKYSLPQTTVQVSVFQSGDYVMVSVKDQGPGIPENEVSTLFDAFHTSSVKSTAGEKSTGLGLTIVQKIVIGHQGKIWVDSHLGKGTTFFFTLPILEEDLQKEKVYKSGATLDIKSNLAETIPLNILVVDDEPDQVALTSLLLGQLGYSPQSAGNAQQALEKINQHDYDLVFLDIQLPDIDGITAARHLNQHYPKHRRPRIVSITGTNISQDQCVQAGMDGCLRKPVALEDLQSTIIEIGGGIRKPSDTPEAMASENVPSSPNENQSLEKQSCLDQNTINGFKSIDPEFLNELIDMFMEQTPVLIQELRNAIEYKDSEQVLHLVKQLQGSSSTLGAKPLAQWCVQHIENQNTGNSISEHDFINQLEVLFGQTAEALEQIRDK